MQRSEALKTLRSKSGVLKARGAVSLYLFGSTVRNRAHDDSDLDLFLDYDPASRFSLLDLAGIKNFLEDELGLPVDVTTRDSLHPALREEIEHTAEQVY